MKTIKSIFTTVAIALTLISTTTACSDDNSGSTDEPTFNSLGNTAWVGVTSVELSESGNDINDEYDIVMVFNTDGTVTYYSNEIDFVPFKMTYTVSDDKLTMTDENIISSGTFSVKNNQMTWNYITKFDNGELVQFNDTYRKIDIKDVDKIVQQFKDKYADMK